MVGTVFVQTLTSTSERFHNLWHICIEAKKHSDGFITLHCNYIDRSFMTHSMHMTFRELTNCFHTFSCNYIRQITVHYSPVI
jgi:hypothetical protein